MKKLLLILLFLAPLAVSAQWVNLPSYKLQKTVDGYQYQFVYTNSGGGPVRFYQKAQVDSIATVIKAIITIPITYPTDNSTAIRQRPYALVQHNTGVALIDSVKALVIPKTSTLTAIDGSVQTTLVAGTKAITMTGVTTSSQAYVTRAVPNTATLTVVYDAVCTSGTVTVTAKIGATTINTADISVVNVVVFN